MLKTLIYPNIFHCALHISRMIDKPIEETLTNCYNAASRHLTKSIAALEIVTENRLLDVAYVKKVEYGSDDDEKEVKAVEVEKKEEEAEKKSDEVDKNAEEAAEKSEAEKAFEKHINEATPVVEPESQLVTEVYHPDAQKLAEAQSLVEDLGLGSPAPLKLKDYNAEFEAKVKEAGDNESFKAYKYAVEIRYRGHINFW